MTKTEKKIEANIISSLTRACEKAKHIIPGFLWLTHKVNYKNIDKSLTVYCVFESEHDINTMKQSALEKTFAQVICQELQKNKIQLKSPQQQIHYMIESHFSLH